MSDTVLRMRLPRGTRRRHQISPALHAEFATPPSDDRNVEDGGTPSGERYKILPHPDSDRVAILDTEKGEEVCSCVDYERAEKTAAALNRQAQQERLCQL